MIKKWKKAKELNINEDTTGDQCVLGENNKKRTDNNIDDEVIEDILKETIVKQI